MQVSNNGVKSFELLAAQLGPVTKPFFQVDRAFSNQNDDEDSFCKF